MKSLDEVFERLGNLQDYLDLRIDIVGNDVRTWTSVAKYLLPTFDYYIKNCVEDKGGKYDFSVRRYSSPAQVLQPIGKFKKFSRKLVYSYWMGTPFNYKEVCSK